MSRLSQNIMYAVIIIAVFAICVYFFASNKNYETKGIFLSKYSVELPKVDPDNVRIYNLRYQDDAKGSVGLIRVATHTTNKDDFTELCDRNLKKAVELAAKNGTDEIKYICLYPEGPLDELSNVSLQAYAFRG
ncbi:hypothetical protein IB642_03610 [Allofrancisella guangzhouensis]|uniref:Membrane protein n=1 Tax=Allofrancisella guangzhouensis TaxID=594679 RepID=A0A0A8E4H2_9GAMM|nr:hypothetical protein [Allofrancisella guangzhouensis]AJC48923.1 membrane protein [Allofrancisella guangzhouensis]MBK2027112.1 hypothetical protein [Allofrancisella guangzhouensis]MBK2044106.1 hypothetical protein [Allofrancisella guangzhouensis]MBK2045650.1 hypothetical protein [Allofrancisella guangzhouensis]